MSTTYISCPVKSARICDIHQNWDGPNLASIHSPCLISSTYSCNNWPLRLPNDHTASLSLKFQCPATQVIQMVSCFSNRWPLQSPWFDLPRPTDYSHMIQPTQEPHLSSLITRLVPSLFWSKAGWLMQQVFSLSSTLELQKESTKILNAEEDLSYTKPFIQVSLLLPLKRAAN